MNVPFQAEGDNALYLHSGTFSGPKSEKLVTIECYTVAWNFRVADIDKGS